MALQRQCLVAMTSTAFRAAARPRPQLAAAANTVPRFLVPALSMQNSQSRFASHKHKKDDQPNASKVYKSFRVYDKKKLVSYSLCDAMRYLRAIEVGRPPTKTIYEVAVKLVTPRAGMNVRDRIHLPFPIGSDLRIAVVCPEDSQIAKDALMDGAVAVGEETLFEKIRAGEINFNRMICHVDSLPALSQAKLARILGPKGLMPNTKNKTITSDVHALIRDMAGTADYRERDGVVRMAVGQLNYSPQMLGDNIRALLAQIRSNIRDIERQTAKSIDEVVLSSTNGPGFSLSGAVSSTDEAVTEEMLSTVM